MFCLTLEKINKFKEALKKRQIKIEDLLNMETEERTKLFEEYAGESAKAVNTLFEEKLILKNRLQGIKNWASKVGEIGRYDPAKKAKLDALMSEFRARQQERIFNPKENEAFLADLAEEKLGIRISKDEAKNVFDLTAKIDELRKGFDEKKGKWANEKDRFSYGASKVALDNYMSNLEGENAPVRQLLKERLAEFRKTAEENKPKAVFDLLKDVIKQISDNSIALVASFDNSFLGRQGLKTLMTHPSAWLPAAKNSFVDFYNTLGGKNTMEALMADIYSRPNYLNGSYNTAKIIAKTEEQFPAILPERVPYFGKIFKGSEVAFRGSALRMRTDLYDLISDKATESEVDMTDKYQIQSIGKMINSLTARGQWGKQGEPAVVRLILWAPKMLKANIDVLTVHTGQDISSFARKEAVFNLLKIVSLTTLIMLIANAIDDDWVEFDPRSANFGKIKIGDTRFDITGGASSLIVLASRLITNSTKSATTGVVSKFGAGYGQTSRFDILIDFLSGKTTPAMGVLINLMKGEGRMGKPLTVGGELYGAGVPISLQNFINLKDNASVDRILGAFADIVGISATSYSVSEQDWSQNMGVEMTQFKEKIGDDKFKEANDKFNVRVNEWFNSVKDDQKFNDLTDDEKKDVITKKKSDIKDKIFREYHFFYRQAPKKVLPRF